ncbi:MAG TPA: helix-turn-helix domain-containing protein [Beijerinckiaceae bacterium]|jgi:CRP/FNR family transcriptional regulator
MYALNSNNCAHLARPFTTTSESLESLFCTQPSETFAPGQAIFWQADPAQDVFEIRKGVMRLYRILPDGKRAIVGFIFPGDILGVAYRDQYLFTAEAITEVAVRRLSRSRFDSRVNESADLRPLLLTRLCDEMCAAQDQMLALLHHSADARVAHFLLTVARKTTGDARKGSEIQMAMSRSDIADYLGLTIETICRCVSKLKTEGLITLHGPYRIVIEEPRALRELAGEDYQDDALRMRATAAAWPT